MQASTGGPVTTGRHTTMIMAPGDLELLALLDGNSSHQQLGEKWSVASLNAGHSPDVSGPDTGLNSTLQRFCKDGLLVA